MYYITLHTHTQNMLLHIPWIHDLVKVTLECGKSYEKYEHVEVVEYESI